MKSPSLLAEKRVGQEGSSVMKMNGACYLIKFMSCTIGELY